MKWQDLEFFKSNKFNSIIRFIKREELSGKTVLPPKNDILNAFYYTELDEVKVVIIGQDPYHQISPQYAHGLAFSIRPDIKPLPKSLINILKELKDDIGNEKPDGDLTNWANQGVLLLNTSLTVCAGNAGSHSRLGWGLLVEEVIKTINKNKEHVVFILWGKQAQELEMYIDKDKHYVVKSAHPSPLSAHRGFFGSKPFSKTNEYLMLHNIKSIDW
jgi:uracil-DNA glycosylase